MRDALDVYERCKMQQMFMKDAKPTDAYERCQRSAGAEQKNRRRQ
jgi:hypothetical protein